MFDAVNDTHRFRHPYAYYYFFLAEYITARMNTPEMQALVVKLCREVSTKESATLLVFLAYRSETTQLITEIILSGLGTLYSKATPFEFSIDRAATVNMLINELPNMIFDAERTSERRLQRLDTEEREEAEAAVGDEEEESNPMSSMKNTFTTIEILGHILRNHYAKLDAQPKLAILDHSSAAILRCLGDLFDTLTKSGEALVQMIAIVSDKVDSAKKREDKVKAAQHALFYIAQLVVFYCSRQLARAMGDENLEVTYRQVLQENRSTTTRSFLDVLLKT